MEFEIQSDSYKMKVQYLSKDILKSEHSHYYHEGRQVEAYASNWCLALAHFSEDNVCSIRSENRWLPLTGRVSIFIPPFSIIELKVERNKEIKWTSVMSTSQLPFLVRPHPVLMQTTMDCPKNQDETFAFIQSLMQKGTHVIESRFPSAIAEKAKKYINTHFKEKAMITDMAKSMRVSRVVLSRSFSLNYGISLTTYRHRLRLFEALSLLNIGWSITDAIAQVGFADSSQFNLQFKKYFGAQPKMFSICSNGAIKKKGTSPVYDEAPTIFTRLRR